MNVKVEVEHILGATVVIVILSFVILWNQPQPSFNYTVGQCGASNYQHEFNIEVRNHDLIVHHILPYVCCADITVRVDQSDHEINFFEVNTGDVCRCICVYNVSATVSNLDPGTYTVRIFGVEYKDQKAKLLYNSSVSIPT